MDNNIDEKLKELRDKRNEYNTLAASVQKEIDKLELEKHSVPDLTDKYVLYIEDEYTTLFLKVLSIVRLNNGIRIITHTILEMTDEDIRFSHSDYEYIQIDYKNIDNIFEIPKERYDYAIEDAINFLKQNKE